MADTPQPHPGSRIDRAERQDHHQRPPDPAEAVDRPLEDKDPGAPREFDPDQEPHHALNRPVGEPDPTADSDPFEGSVALPDPGDAETDEEREVSEPDPAFRPED